MSVTIGPNLNSPSPPESNRTNRSGANNQTQRAADPQEVVKSAETTAQQPDAVALNPTLTQAGASASGTTLSDSRSANEAAGRAKQMMSQNPQMAVMAQANASPAAVLALLQRA